ncbi:hypothetical protein BASA50_004008 [Batrachochytrium salamandrivorans]|uniref:RRM domain-containing protein n=1 Tax=Batrachochytrium salamandrivorans TaxID=1357716 RepID=A0ABQ8FGZ0_9FUNG|nr:hypothetical protein BASA50_004008 [Batrachochytrium salamandrivorans]
MASRLGVGFLAGVLTTTTAYSLMQASLASDTEVLNHALVSSRMQVESVLPAHLQSTCFGCISAPLIPTPEILFFVASLLVSVPPLAIPASSHLSTPASRPLQSSSSPVQPSTKSLSFLKEITMTTAATTPAAAHVEAVPATTVEQESCFKVFVGNLPYRTTPEALKGLFVTAGAATDAQLIKRQGRSMGFGFVSFQTLPEAESAIQLFHQKEFEGRTLNVELALSKPRAPTEGAEGESAAASGPNGGSTKPKRVRVRKPRSAAAKAEGVTGGDVKAAPSVAPGAGLVDGDEQQSQQQSASTTTKPKRVRVRKPRSTAGATAAATTESGAAGGSGAPRPERAPRVHEGEPSKTTIFVGNLPFKVGGADLMVIFKDYAVKSAHVVETKLGRSKGYGFLEMESEADQQKVLDDLKDAVVAERKLIVRAAFSDPVAVVATEGGAATSAPSAAATTTTTTTTTTAAVAARVDDA